MHESLTLVYLRWLPFKNSLSVAENLKEIERLAQIDRSNLTRTFSYKFPVNIIQTLKKDLSRSLLNMKASIRILLPHIHYLTRREQTVFSVTKEATYR